MVRESEEKVPIPVNYRRAVNSPMWVIIAFLCVKRQKRPNDLIDCLIKQAYVEEKSK